MVQPHFDYCISVWGNLSLIHINKLQNLQNRAAKIICKEFDWNTSSTVLHSRLHWMNLKTRRDYFAGILMFKNIKGPSVPRRRKKDVV